jgi:hypothetical protein
MLSWDFVFKPVLLHSHAEPTRAPIYAVQLEAIEEHRLPRTSRDRGETSHRIATDRESAEHRSEMHHAGYFNSSRLINTKPR